MKAALLDTNGFSLSAVDDPACPDDGMVVQTAVCGVCDSDIQKFRTVTEKMDGYDFLRGKLLGHEGSGVVAAVGKQVTGYRVGDRVTAIDGAFADYFATTPDRCVTIPGSMKWQESLGEPLACCMHAAGRFELPPGGSVAVIGCGFMGLVSLQLARLAGAGTVCAWDLIPARLSMAKKLGADRVALSDVNEEVDEWHGGSFDLVLEATGTQPGLDRAAALVRPHGRMVVLGYHQSNGGMRTVNMKLWNFKAMDVVNGHVRHTAGKVSAMKEAIALVRDGRLLLEPLTARYPLASVNQAFSDALSRRDTVYKPVILPQSTDDR